MTVARLCWRYLVVGGLVLVPWGEAGAQHVAADDGMLARRDCVGLVRRVRAEEADGMREIMAQEPAQVAHERGPAFLQRVQDYIALREAVLFRCPPNVLNATAAPLEERLQAEPPLPGKGPKRARPTMQRRPGAVPLPMPRPI
jgi:hypothetical protein